METSRERPPLVEGEDFYRDGAYVVFTARYHLRRGYCCESGCRHCPYRDAPESYAEQYAKSQAQEFEKEAEGEA